MRCHAVLCYSCVGLYYRTWAAACALSEHVAITHHRTMVPLWCLCLNSSVFATCNLPGCSFSGLVQILRWVGELHVLHVLPRTRASVCEHALAAELLLLLHVSILECLQRVLNHVLSTSTILQVHLSMTLWMLTCQLMTVSHATMQRKADQMMHNICTACARLPVQMLNNLKVLADMPTPTFLHTCITPMIQALNAALCIAQLA